MQINISWTLVIAAWGAILSTVVFLWDIYKWRTAGPRLRFSVTANMKRVDMDRPGDKGETIIAVKATNYGDRPTTITNIGYLYYRDRRWIPREPDKKVILTNPKWPQRPPFELKPGSRWMVSLDQTAEIEQMSREGKLFFLLFHSHTEKPVKRRLIIQPDKK